MSEDMDTDMDTSTRSSIIGDDVLMKGQENLPSHFTNSGVKLEDENYDSDSAHVVLRTLRSEDDDRDSPNSSMTSASLISGTESKPSNPSHLPRNKSLTTNPESPMQRSKIVAKFRAKSSIPTKLSPAEYGRQCVAAALSCRLNPYALHEDEHLLLQDRLCHLHVRVYLNIRNGIVRLWARNPNVSVNLEEAIGCAKDERWTQLACFAYEWLVRRGYINFGCVEVPLGIKTTKGRRNERGGQTIVVIGGGMAGLSCARQLTSVFNHFPDHPAPRIVVLEGRGRIGGRIYSHPLMSMRSDSLAPHQRPTAEMGAHIVVGFEHGNPLDAIVRGQLALDCHSLRDLSTLYDIDGSAVDEHQDTMVERLYNDVLDRSGRYRYKRQQPRTATGEKEMVDLGRDTVEDDGLTISQYEEATASGTIDSLLPTKSKRRGVGHKAAKQDKPGEEVDTDMHTQTQLPAATAAREIGFHLRSTTKMDESLELDRLAACDDASLGAVLDEGVRQYSRFLDLRPKAMRLLNWHFANLEYANATNVARLSLSGWDQDSGNEFEGEHAQVIGGYQQVPRALWKFPEKLDVRTNKPVSEIRYDVNADHGKASVTCEDGEVIEADKVILTVPLGVLKQQSIQFVPPLPKWKQGAISNLGFGLLNKIVLVFDEPFWDVDRDMFGLLREPRSGNGLDQDDYRAGRGQFYLFWNCIKTSGLPVLIALMAGDSAQEAEVQSDHDLVSSCVAQLQKVFGDSKVPTPTETIVTRWGSDRFARGTYSFVAAEAKPQDYDVLARSIGNLFFAGEATCGSHPATVHGAYLSGLRAASEVLEAIVGPIQVPDPLVAQTKSRSDKPVDLSAVVVTPTTAPKRKGDPVIPAGTFTRPVKEANSSLQQEWESAMWDHIYSTIGFAPPQPSKSGTNPFLLYQKEHWNACKERCDARNRTSTGKANAKSGRDEVRIELGRMWKLLSEEEKAPYNERTKTHKEANDGAIEAWKAACVEWDKRTWEVKDEWIQQGNAFEDWLRERNTGGLDGAAGQGGKRYRVAI
jgi:monoamine oxidase